MTSADLLALLPLIALALSAVVVMLVIAFMRSHIQAAVLTLAGLAVSFALTFIGSSAAPYQVTPLLVFDPYSIFYTRLLLIAGFFTIPFAYTYLSRRKGRQEEFYLLVLLATLGAVVLVWSNHFASFFLGLEVLSVSLYGLAAYTREAERSVEAGLKYLILAAVSAAILLFGMALTYADQGTMSLTQIVKNPGQDLLFLSGLGLIVVGVGFKLGVVPFHMWIADVYDGAPAPAGMFIATVSKGAVLALLLRFFLPAPIHDQPAMLLVFGLIAVSSILVGNLLALLQNNLKRLLAYSSIAHFGYLLVAFLAGGEGAALAASFYLVAYVVTTLGAFGVISILSGPERDADMLENYRGLFWRRPILGVVLAAMMFSLAGLPLTAGFIGKFYVLTAGIGSELWLPAIILVIGSVIGLFYYLRVIVMMYSASEEPTPSAQTALTPLATGLTLAVLVLLLVWFGLYPNALIALIQNTVGGLI